jgi:hypothetical protein
MQGPIRNSCSVLRHNWTGKNCDWEILYLGLQNSIPFRRALKRKNDCKMCRRITELHKWDNNASICEPREISLNERTAELQKTNHFYLFYSYRPLGQWPGSEIPSLMGGQVSGTTLRRIARMMYQHAVSAGCWLRKNVSDRLPPPCGVWGIFIVQASDSSEEVANIYINRESSSVWWNNKHLYNKILLLSVIWWKNGYLQ